MKFTVLAFARGEHKFRTFSRVMHGSYLRNTLERGESRLSHLTTLRNTFIDDI